MNVTDILYAKKLAGGGGGGGGGDFSTAEVTFINTSTHGASAPYYIYITHIDEDNECIVNDSDSISIIPSNPITLKLPLYKGVFIWNTLLISGSTNIITVTGDITNVDGWLNITGNGTISAEGEYL